MAYCACATAIPYPGTITTLLLLTSSYPTCSMLLSTCYLCWIYFFFADASVHVPKITLLNERFIALHIMYDRIAPDEPMSEPTIVSIGLASMKPYAHNAQPE